MAAWAHIFIFPLGANSRRNLRCVRVQLPLNSPRAHWILGLRVQKADLCAKAPQCYNPHQPAALTQLRLVRYPQRGLRVAGNPLRLAAFD